MLKRVFPALLLLALVAVGAIGLSAPSLQATPASGIAGAPFDVDAGHSTIVFRLRHFGVAWFYGQIQKPTGTFLIDPNDLAGSELDLKIEIKNMDAGNRSRDQFLKGPDFFNAKEYPTATFKSKSIKQVDGATFEVTGVFTLHGVSKTVTVPLTDYAEASTTKFGYRAGFECTLTFNRSDYGIDQYVKEGTLGDEVRLIVSIEGKR